MNRAKSGDTKAFGQLVRQHQKRIYRVALHMLRDAAEAEDVTQDTFVRAYAAMARFDGRSQPYTWFYRIAVNLSLNRIRSRKRHRSVAAEDDPRLEAVLQDPHPSAHPERSVSDHQMARDLCDAIDGLSETLRTTLILVVIDGLAHTEAAGILGCPEGTVAWRIHEARKKIREYLDARAVTKEEDES
jgi:RNA polymerase sigma-70 factor (ECF subfamily)